MTTLSEQSSHHGREPSVISDSPAGSTVPRTDTVSLFDGFDIESVSDTGKFCTDFSSRIEKLDMKGSQVTLSALEASSKLTSLLKYVKERANRTIDSFDAQPQATAALANIRSCAIDLYLLYQSIESKSKEFDRLRVEFGNLVASPGTIDRIATGKHRYKIVSPTTPIVQINGGSGSHLKSFQSEGQGSGVAARSDAPTSALQSAAAPTPSGPPKMKLPKEITDANLPKPEVMRLMAVYELIETEADYCRDLSTMINFYKPLVKESRLVTDAEFSVLFSNVEQLLTANQVLLGKLNARKEQNVFLPEISDLVGECAEGFKVYTTYAANYPAAMKIIHTLQQRQDSKEILQSWMLCPEARGLSLESFLIKPVQRICKYPLLLRELERHNEKAGNAKDASNARTSNEKIEAVTMLVNEATRAAEERQRILNLEAQIESPISFNFAEKKHLKDGNLPRLVSGKPKDRYVILFTDTMLICKPSKTGVPKWELEAAYSLAELILKQEGKDSSRVKAPSITFTVITSDDKETLSFVPYSDDDRAKWIDVFFLAFKDITEEHRSAVRSSINHSLVRQSALDNSSGMNSLRGMGIGSLANRKGKPGMNRQASTVNPNQLRKAAARKTMLESFGNPNAAAHLSFILPDPETVDISGSIYKRAFSATGHTYYCCFETKQSIWKLPETYTVVDGTYGKQLGSDSASPQSQKDSRTSLLAAEIESNQDGEEDEMVGLELVEGYPDWRKVDRGDGQPYYFNINTKETRWDPPSSDDGTEGNESQEQSQIAAE